MRKELSLHVGEKGIDDMLVSVRECAPQANQYHLRVPSLCIRGQYFYCDDEALSFRNATRKLNLLTCFLSAPDYCLNREQIIALVYRESFYSKHRDRFIDCLHMNMLRTISDTRRQLYISFAHRYPGIDWLFFNRSTKAWRLLRFKEDYVLSKLAARIY